MKKIFTLILSFVSLFTLISCNEKKESIDDPKEFTTGDIVEYNGIIYEYLNLQEIIRLPGKEFLEYVFEEEEDYKAYYSVYYPDMSDITNQPKLREDEIILERINNPSFYLYNKTPYEDPIHIYNFSVLENLDLGSLLYKELIEGSFIVKGYTEELPEDVVIPQSIYGKYVAQIGYKAFFNAPMKTLKLEGGGYVHPFAISNCPNLKEVNLERGLVMSMGISNCENIEKIIGISPTMDCSLYNLPRLTELEQVGLFFSHKSWFFYDTCYGMGGLRKSFFYNCPRLRSISGGSLTDHYRLITIYNTVYYSPNGWFNMPSTYPLYVYDNYTAIVDDRGFTYDLKKGSDNFTIMYDPETLEAYVPFLNDGLEKEGKILFKHGAQDETAVEEDETGIYINAIYLDPQYNAKLLFKRK